jgi:hypothetical protein
MCSVFMSEDDFSGFALGATLGMRKDVVIDVSAPIAPDWKRSSWTGAGSRSMSGGPSVDPR